jgi:hypothetical protein
MSAECPLTIGIGILIKESECSVDQLWVELRLSTALSLDAGQKLFYPPTAARLHVFENIRQSRAYPTPKVADRLNEGRVASPTTKAVVMVLDGCRTMEVDPKRFTEIETAVTSVE